MLEFSLIGIRCGSELFGPYPGEKYKQAEHLLPINKAEMGFYDKHILPRLLHFACGLEEITSQRLKVVPFARGVVLEIGIGSGLNLPYYDLSRTGKVIGLDPSAEMRSIAKKGAHSFNFDVLFIEGSSEQIPLPDAFADTVLVTYTLCTIQDIARALKEIHRVLEPGGELIFCEHGIAIDRNIRRWQNRLNPIWNRFTGGCHLNRDIPALIERAGFQIKSLDHCYIPGWRPACFNYWGKATQKDC